MVVVWLEAVVVVLAETVAAATRPRARKATSPPVSRGPSQIELSFGGLSNYPGRCGLS